MADQVPSVDADDLAAGQEKYHQFYTGTANRELTEEEKEEGRKGVESFNSLMGVGRLVLGKVEPDQDSIAHPGKHKSCISEPLDKYTTPEKFLDELIEYWRNPVLPLEEFVLKSCEVTDDPNNKNKFDVKVTWDKDKIGRFIPNIKEDPIRTWYTCEYNYEEGWFKNIDLNMPEPKPHCTAMFHKNPFRVEFWIRLGANEDATVRAGPVVATMLQHAFITPLLLKITRRSFSVEPQDSLTDEGEQSVISDGLDEFISYDEIFDGLVDNIEHPYKKNGTVTEKKDGKEKICKMKDAASFPTVTIKLDREAGKIRTLLSGGKKGEEKVFWKEFFVLHQVPLRVEHWRIVPKDGEEDERMAGRSESRILQGTLDKIVQATESGWFW